MACFDESQAKRRIDVNRKSNTGFGGTIRLADGRIHMIMGTGCPCAPPG